MTETPAAVDVWTRECPDTWDIRPLKRVAEVFNSNVDKKSYDGGVPVRLCNYTDVYHREFITHDLPLMAATATASEVHRFTLRAGDVIITKDSESWNDIAVPACVPDDLSGVVCGYHLTMLRPTRSRIQGRFLLRCLQASGIRDQFWVAANGITRFGLGQSAIRDALVPVPPLETQRGIADFLDRKTAAIDALIEKKERLIALLEEKRQALITQAVTKGLDPTVPMKDSGIEWLGEIPAHWEVMPLWSVLRAVKEQGFPHLTLLSVFREHGVVPKDSRSDNHNRPGDDLAVYQKVEVGDVVVNKMKAWQGSVSTSSYEGIVSPDYLVLRPRGFVVETGFLHHLLRSARYVSQYKRLSYGVRPSQWRLMFRELRDVPLVVPPLEQQRELMTRLASADDQIRATTAAIERQLGGLREYRQALITAAVTGQLDIPTLEAT